MGRPRVELPGRILDRAMRHGWGALRIWTELAGRGIYVSLPTIRKRLQEHLRPDHPKRAPRHLTGGVAPTLRVCPGCQEPRHPAQFRDTEGNTRDLCSLCDTVGARYP